MRATWGAALLVAVGVLLVVAVHEADAVADVVGTAAWHQHSIADGEVQELGAGSPDPMQLAKEAEKTVAKEKEEEAAAAKEAEESGMSKDTVEALEEEHVKQKEEAAEKDLAKAEADNEVLPSTDDVLESMNRVQQPKAQDEADEIKPGDITEITKEMKKDMMKKGMLTGLSKAQKEAALAFMEKRARQQAILEVGIPEHIVEAILADPDKARGMFDEDGLPRPPKGEEDPEEIPGDESADSTQSTMAVVEEEADQEAAAEGNPVAKIDKEETDAQRKERLTQRLGETMEEYFVRLLKDFGKKQGLVFDTEDEAGDWFLQTAGRLTRSVKGAGWESNIMKAEMELAQARVEQLHVRVKGGRHKLAMARGDLTKEVKRKQVAGTMAEQYNAIKKSAAKSKSKKATDEAKLRQWNKKSSELKLQMKEEANEARLVDKDMGGALARQQDADKQAEEARKQNGEEEKTKEEAAKQLKAANAELLSATTQEARDAAKSKVQAAESLAKTVEANEDAAEKAQDTVTADEQTASAGVVMDETKLKALKAEEAKSADELKKTEELKTMFKTKSKMADKMEKTGADKAIEMEKAFVNQVLNAVRDPRVLKIKSATYICPNQINPKTQKTISNDDLLAQLSGNQNVNLRKACNEYEECNYMVDPSEIGEAAAGCKKYAYFVEYSCVAGDPKKQMVNETDAEVMEVVSENEEDKKNDEAEKEREQEAGYGNGDESLDTRALTMALLQFDEAAMKPVTEEVEEAEKEEGATKAQQESTALNKDIGNLKETLEDGQEVRKSDNPEEEETTEDAIKEEKAEMKKLGMDKPLNSEEDPVETKPAAQEMKAELEPGEGRRVLKLKCAQPQDPVIVKTQKHVNAAQAALDEAIKEMQSQAEKKEDDIDEKIAADKAQAAADNEKANAELGSMAKYDELIKEAEAEMDALQKSLAATTDDDAKAELQDKIEAMADKLADLKSQKEKASADKEKAMADKEQALQDQDDQERKFGASHRTELHSSSEIRMSEMSVEGLRKKLRTYEEMVAKLTEALTDSTDTHMIAVREKQLINMIRERQILDMKFAEAEHRRDEMLLDIEKKKQEAFSEKAEEDEKALELLQDQAQTLKAKLATASPAAKSTLLTKFTEVEQKLNAAKATMNTDEKADVLKEATIVTKAEKGALVSERQKELVHKEEKTKLKQQELEVALTALKESKEPEAIMKLTAQITTLKQEMGADSKEAQDAEDKLQEAKNVDPKTGDTLVAKMEGTVADAKAMLGALEAEKRTLEEDIESAEDPAGVEQITLELADTKKKIAAAKQTVIRREKDVKKVETVVEKEKEAPADYGYGDAGSEGKGYGKGKKGAKESPATEEGYGEVGLSPQAAKLEEHSPALQALMEKVENLKAKLKGANSEFAEAINNVLRTKEGKMKRTVKSLHKSLAYNEQEFDKARADYVKVKKKFEGEGKHAHTFNKIKDALLTGKYEEAMKVHSIHEETKDTSKFDRSPEEVAQTRLEYSTPNPQLGSCAEPLCCLKSFKDPICKDPRDQMCKYKMSQGVEEWRDMTTFSAPFKTVGNEVVGTVNRTMTAQAMWVSNGLAGKKNALSLEIQICGKFTKFGSEGVNICFPQDADGSPRGVPIGSLFGAQAGACVRSEDFAAVVKGKVKSEVMKGIEKLRHQEKMKEEADKLPKPKPKIDQITQAVSRAIGGAFTGGLGGVDMQQEVLAFIDESSTEEWEALLQLDGSFMITHDQPPNALNATNSTNKKKAKDKEDNNWNVPPPEPPIVLPPVQQADTPQ